MTSGVDTTTKTKIDIEKTRKRVFFAVNAMIMEAVKVK
jgi:hypothetical protein